MMIAFAVQNMLKTKLAHYSVYMCKSIYGVYMRRFSFMNTQELNAKSLPVFKSFINFSN